MVLKYDSYAKIKSAKDGFEAADLLFSFSPDVILLDDVMPGFDGFEVCNKIKKDKKNNKIKIILMANADKVNSMIIMLVIVILFIFPGVGSAQQDKVDSLLIHLDETDGREKIDLLNQLAYAYRRIDSNIRIKYSETALALANELDYPEGESAALNNIGAGNYRLKNYETAVEYYNRSLAISKSINDSLQMGINFTNLGHAFDKLQQYEKSLVYFTSALNICSGMNDINGMAASYHNIGLEYWRSGRFAEAIESYNNAVKYRIELNNNKVLGHLYNNLGVSYENLGNYESALEYYLKSVRIRESSNDVKGVVLVNNNIGRIYKVLGDLKQAHESCSHALQLARDSEYPEGIAYSLRNIGEIYEFQKNFPGALKNYQESLELYTETGLKGGIADSYNNIGSINKKKGDFTEALYNFNKALVKGEEINYGHGIVTYNKNIGHTYLLMKNPDKALGYLQKSLNMALREEMKVLARENYLYLSELYSLKNNYKKSFENLKLYSVLKDSIFSEESMKKITGLQTTFKVRNKEKEIELLKSGREINRLKLKREQTLKYSSYAGSVFLILSIGLLYSRYRVKNRTNKLIGSKNEELKVSIEDLKKSIQHIKRLEGLLPICASCKQIRINGGSGDDQKNWIQIEKYISDRTDADFSHSICPKCAEDLYGDIMGKK